MLREWKDTPQTGRKYLQNKSDGETDIQNIQRTLKTQQ